VGTRSFFFFFLYRLGLIEGLIVDSRRAHSRNRPHRRIAELEAQVEMLQKRLLAEKTFKDTDGSEPRPTRDIPVSTGRGIEPSSHQSCHCITNSWTSNRPEHESTSLADYLLEAYQPADSLLFDDQSRMLVYRGPTSIPMPAQTPVARQSGSSRTHRPSII
jgi:hypothetical protein